MPAEQTDTEAPEALRLDDIRAGANLEGLEPGKVVTVAAVTAIDAGSLQVFYRLPDGSFRERMLSAADLSEIRRATVARPWSFDGEGAAFQLAAEAKRIQLAFLFDPMMAVHTSSVEPLPHQITAVYESMLPRQPLRFVLADDPGAGKTVMAGLYIRELMMRADARRVCIITPGSLVEQWRDELLQKFGLEFRIFSRELDAASTGNPFEDHDALIVRLDQLSRSDEYQQKICVQSWDLVIFDEAHKLSAHYFGNELKRTRRFALAEKIGAQTRNLLLMTATPHNGKEEDFQLFLSLLDADRFHGKFRGGVHEAEVSDLMRRMVKEELVKFDGTPLFPERHAYTINYQLSSAENDLYERVTSYVREEMGKADKLEGRQRGSIGFALTALQRRLASSPEAIFQSLRRRRERLERRRDDARAVARKQPMAEVLLAQPPDDEDDLDAAEQEALEEQLVSEASAARTIGELEAEILILQSLQRRAQDLVASSLDRKWEELSRILQGGDPRLHDASGRLRKIILFTEHRDTLNYLVMRISGVLGDPEAIVTIHGGTQRDERRRVQELFRSDPAVRVLIATDAAGEGVNLQNASLMVNYDLPWNPNRLEQRFGRIHRIGQREVCHLWNLVANETREGAVYHRLLEKLRIENDALKGRVFDILGEVFDGVSLREMLIDAIRYGDQPEVRARLQKRVDHALDPENLRKILDRHALAREAMTPKRLFAVREEMEKAEARRLQPHFVRAFFLRAFQSLGGSIYPREAGRFEISHVPSSLRERDQNAPSRGRRSLAPVLRRYERVCFSREATRPTDRPGLTEAQLLHPGHPLTTAVTDLILEQNSNLLRQGAILVDGDDDSDQPSLLVLLTHEIRSGDAQVLSKRLQFVRVSPSGHAAFAGWAPHLDLTPLPPEDRPLLADLLAAPWLSASLEQRALALAASTLVPQHIDEVTARHIAHTDKVLAAVHERLSREISYWSDRLLKLKQELAAGKDVRLQAENTRRTLLDLEGRLDRRRAELTAARHVASSTPAALGGALVVPAGLLRKLRGAPAIPTFAADAEARRRTELAAMAAVRSVEEARGCKVVDVSADKCGWDLSSYPADPKQTVRHIEVKGRVMGADTLTVTRNEILYALNQADKFILAIVLVSPEGGVVDGPYYLKHPFDSEPGWGVASWNLDLKQLIARSEKQAP